MGLLELFRVPDINRGLEEFARTPGAVLLDVREPDEYRLGRVPHSRNLPLSRLHDAVTELKDKSTPLFVYCYSGSRSARAAALLRRMGYTCVTDIGGISGYRGRTEAG